MSVHQSLRSARFRFLDMDPAIWYSHDTLNDSIIEDSTGTLLATEHVLLRLIKQNPKTSLAFLLLASHWWKCSATRVCITVCRNYWTDSQWRYRNTTKGFEIKSFLRLHRKDPWISQPSSTTWTGDMETKVLLRNYRLSDDIAFRFGNSTVTSIPMYRDLRQPFKPIVD